MPRHAIPGDPQLNLDETLLHPGQRIAIAVSGGADSVALLRALLSRREALGLVLSVAHVHHGIRGEAADGDQAFVEALAAEHCLPIHIRTVDTPARVAEHHETIEEAARHLRYIFFRELIDSGMVDAVATAHTLDDQAETVLHKFLRGAWTEGLGGISPVVVSGRGSILRPMLSVTRVGVEVYLRSLGQAWCEDATNRDLAHMRNRLRHHLLPILADYNPQLATQLSRVATIARDEEMWWQREVARVGNGLLLPGKPVRGGGRSASTHPDEASVALELERLRTLDPAMRRRILRWAAERVQCSLDFDHTQRLVEMCSAAAGTGKRVDLDGRVYAQRTARELQLVRHAAAPRPQTVLAIELPIPGRIATAGWVFSTTLLDQAAVLPSTATIRTVVPGDRVTLRYSRGPKKAREIFERMQVPPAERAARLAVAWEGAILWMEGVEIAPESLPALPFRLVVERAI